MSIELDTEVRQALHHTAGDIKPRADLLSAVRGGGRRRQRRRRAVLAGGVAALVALGLLAGTVIYRAARPTGPDPAHPGHGVFGQQLLTRPTGGDRAHDQTFLKQAVAAWRTPGFHWEDRPKDGEPGVEFHQELIDHLQGSPHVVWAGNTSAGPFAFVVQATTVSAATAGKWVDPGDVGTHVLLGFVGPGTDGRGGSPSLIATRMLVNPGQAGSEPGTTTGSNTYAIRLDKTYSTLVVLDAGQPVFYSTERGYRSDGVHRNWQQVRFRDGASVIRLSGRDGGFSLELATTTHLTTDNEEVHLVGVANQPPSRKQPDNTLDWGPPPVYTTQDRRGSTKMTLFPVTPDADRQHWSDDKEHPIDGFFDALQKSPFYDTVGYPALGPISPWAAYGRASDGSLFAVGEVQYEADPSQLYLVVRNPAGKVQVSYAGPVDRAAKLPVKVKLPGGRGWVVVQKGATLEYRTATGGWKTAGTNAALLPVNATQVRINGKSVVSLPG